MRWRWRILIALLALPFVAVAALWFAVDSAPVRAWLTATIVEAVSVPGEMEVAIEDMGPGLPGSINIGAVTVADRDGVWLRIEAIALDWNPWALIGGNVVVDDLTVGTVAVLREPLPSATTPEPDAGEGDIALPEAPGIGIDVARLEIATIALDGSLLGTPASYRLTGNADLDDGGAGTLVLDLNRLDGASGHFALRFDVDLGDDTLAIDAEAAEGRDGLLVHLLDIAPYPAFSATLAAKGTVSDWDGTLSLVLVEIADAEARFSVRREGETMTVTTQGTAHPGGLLDDQTASLLGEAVTWDGEIALAGQRLTLNDLAVTTDPATVTTSGTVGLEALDLDLTVAASGKETAAVAELAAPLRLAGWTLDGRLGGTAQAPVLSAVLEVEQPRAEGMGAQSLRLDVSDLSMLADGGWSVAAQLALVDPDIGDALGNAQLGDRPTLQVRGTVGPAFDAVDLSSVVLDLAAGHLETAVALDTTTGAIDVSGLRADLPLAPLSTLAGLDLSGTMAVTGDINVTAWGESAQGGLRLAASELSTGQAMLDAIVGDAPEIDLTLSGGADRVVVSAATVDLPIWNAKGDFDIDVAAGTLKGRLGGPFQTTQALSAQVDPALQASGTLDVVASGPLAAPKMDVRLRVARGAYDTLALDGAVLDLRELDIASGMTTALRLSLPQAGSELVAQTNLVFDADFSRLSIQELRIAGPGITGGGSLNLDLATTLIDGRVAGQLTDLSTLAEAFQLGAFEGVGVFEATLTPAPQGRQTVEARTWIEQVTMEGVGIGELAVAATVEDAMGTPVLDVRGSFAGVDLGDLTTADKALLTARGGLDALDVTLEARGSDGPGWTFDTSATFGMKDGGSTMTLARLELVTGDHRIATTQVLNVTMDKDGITTDKLVMTIDGGTLRFNLAMGDDHLKGGLSIEAVPLSLLTMIDPALAMQGQFDGNAEFDIDPTNGEAKASFVGSRLRLPAATSDEEAKLSLDATWRGSRLAVAVDITGIEGLSGALKAEWPLTFDPSTGAVEVPPQQRVAGNLTMKGDMARLWQHLPVGSQLLSGDIDVALSVSGMAADPAVQGQARLENGRYENLEWGTIIDDIVLNASSTQSGELQLALDANDGGKGTIKVTGQAAFNENGGLELDARLNLEAAHLVRRDDARLVAGGELTFKGTLAGVDIVGRFETVEADINVAQSLPSSVTVLNAQDAFQDKLGTGPSAPITPWKANLDIIIEMPGKIRVHGRGLESEWSGRITVAGTSNDPQVSAKLNLVRGNLDIIGRRFTLTTGNVELVPADHGDPRFNVVAAIDSGDVTGQLEVSGRLSAPNIKVTTVPPLPEDEALARLMFGKGTGNLSALEAFQLASAISEITGTTSGGSGILDNFRNALGVDVLEVGTDANGQMTVGAGRYISENVYVGVEQGAAAGSSGVVVNIELTDSLSLETEAGADSSGRVGIDWRWDY